MAQLMKGNELSSKIIASVREETNRLTKHGIRAGHALVLVGEDPSSRMYYDAIQKAAVKAGVDIFNHTLPSTVSLNEVLNRAAARRRPPCGAGRDHATRTNTCCRSGSAAATSASDERLP